MPLSGTAYASNDLSDREFIKEWEANPEKGFATLSPSNIIPMKAAIMRYTAIVAKGGWRPLPDVKLQPGASHPAVGILRERLTHVGRTEGRRLVRELRLLRRQGREALSGPNGLAPTGIVDKSTHRRAERAGGGAAQAAQDQPRAPAASTPRRPANTCS